MGNGAARVVRPVRARPFEHQQLPAGTELLSLDVFDTLLWRRVAKPTDAFEVLGQRLADDGFLAAGCTPALFSQLRIRAETLARLQEKARSESLEVTIWQIYEQFPEDAVANVDRKDLVELELGCEHDLTVADLQIVEWCLRTSEAHGIPIVATSNTYFSAGQLRQLCDRPSMADLPIQEFFSSSDHGTGKAQDLFLEVARRMHVDPVHILHIGDDEDADVVSAEAAGVQGLHYGLTEDDELSTVLEREGIVGEPAHMSRWSNTRHGDHGLTALRTRMFLKLHDPARPAAQDVCTLAGATVFGPVLAGFAEWVHGRASALGVTKLLCPMREGRYLKHLLDGAAGYLGSDLPSEVFWTSREACARASIFDGSREELMAAFTNRRGETPLERLAESIGLPPGSVSEFDRTIFEDREDDQERVGDLESASKGRCERFLEFVAGRPDLVAMAQERSEQRRRSLVNHVKAAIGDAQDVALVDVGWSGSVQSALAKILAREDIEVRLQGLYMVNTSATLDKLLAGSHIEAFLGDAGSAPEDMRPILRSPELIEQSCMSDDGSLLQIEDDGTPLLETNLIPTWQAQQRELVQEGVAAFQHAWAVHRLEAPAHAPSLTTAHRQLLRILSRFVGYPTAEEAKVFGRWRHEQNYGSGAVEPLISTTYLQFLRHMSAEQLVELPFDELYWIGGAAALCGDAMGAAAYALMTGGCAPGAFVTEVPAGDAKIYFDYGSGYSEQNSVPVEFAANPIGLSFVEWTGRAGRIRRIRIDPTDTEALLRLDFLAVTVLDERGNEDFAYRWTPDQGVDSLIIVGAQTLRDCYLYLDTNDPQIHVELPTEASPDSTVSVQMAGEYLLAPAGLLTTLARSLDALP
jgi:FMN phosphatase YigB (HAD superfamily)